MTPVAVALTAVEVQHAALVGIARQLEAIRLGLPDRHGADTEAGWSLHIEGAAGELAVAKATDRYWAMPVNTFKQGGDVGNVQVRTRSRHQYDLIVRDDDRDDDVFVLVTGRAPRFLVHGWIRGRDAKRPEWRREHGGRAPAYFVPKEALHLMPATSPAAATP